LGNIRLSYFNNGTGAEVLEENNYYPFGLKHEGYNALAGNPAYAYQYNGKEVQKETGWLDHGWRNYMPETGRWFQLDPMAEKAHSLTPYRYAFNNPLGFVDPDGLWEIQVREVEIMKDGRGTGKFQKVMTFVAEKGDNLKTLSEQTGIQYAELSKGLAGVEISEGKVLEKLGVEKIDKMIDKINKFITGQDRARISNCWGSALSMAIYGTINFRMDKDQDGNPTGTIGDSNNADDMLRAQFEQTDKPAFGDIRRYAFKDGNKSFNEGSNYELVEDGTKAGGTSHYATFLLKNGSGTVYVFSKNGATAKGLWNVNPESTLLGGVGIGYGQPTPIGKGSPNYTRKK
jgi:RHS repeat-associated protein